MDWNSVCVVEKKKYPLFSFVNMEYIAKKIFGNL